ncbi:Fatty acid oxidation complex subunit alpha [Planctomycetes bacterium CA13]|uniref:Fatty acid oxidation complex subunit alpha n=1 Tax=Novipirellula herctigrandis TaxID=2527986 RepID=A0A5C5YWJ7_9BACT|nr:Fatty acid oxidation complex subunit alpha [Planctomycetes bacterium CA13]
MDDTPLITLVGLGVVGRAIFEAHLAQDIAVTVIDQDASILETALDSLSIPSTDWIISEIHTGPLGMPAATLHPRAPWITPSATSLTPILIESIAERLAIKRGFFELAETKLSADWILCSNTSTLRINEISQTLSRADRVCGMHFFMPVIDRDAVELIRTPATSEETITIGENHIRRLGRTPLIASDSPGFIVNRMLSPYLNEATVLLSQGATAQQIEAAAIAFGMPLSPLELIDLIGSRTMFDAGRVYWQAFPTRIDPSPILPAMIKAGRLGRSAGGGFYDYNDGTRSTDLSPDALAICQRYQREIRQLDDGEVLLRLSIAMWTEANLLLQENVAAGPQDIESAMAGGLGFRPKGSWYGFFENLGEEAIQNAIHEYGVHSKTLRIDQRM